MNAAGALLPLFLAAAPCGASPGSYWLREYPLPAVGAHWHVDLEVRDFDEARGRVLKLIEKYKAQSRLPLEKTSEDPGFKYQQFSVTVSRKAAEKMLERLEKLGRVRRAQRKDADLPDHSQEISIKLGRLRAERSAGGELLRRLSAVSALTDELIAHLERAQQASASAKDVVLLNIVLEEKKE